MAQTPAQIPFATAGKVHPGTGEVSNSPAQKPEALHLALLWRRQNKQDIHTDSPAIHTKGCNLLVNLERMPAKVICQTWLIIGPRIQSLRQICLERGLHPRVSKHANVVILANGDFVINL